MSAPTNFVATSGTGAAPITADNFNTALQFQINYAGLKGFTGLANMTVYMQGYTSPNDGGQGNFYWNTVTGTDDGGLTTIVPNGSTSGCWSRIGNSSAQYTPQTVSNAGGSATLTAANVSNQVLLFTGGSTPTNTFPSASAIIGSISGAQTGSISDLLVINENSGTTLIAPGSGVTFSGNLSTGNFSMGATSQRAFKIYIASASAVTVYG